MMDWKEYLSRNDRQKIVGDRFWDKRSENI